MLAVHGMGKVRFEQYGRAFLTAIRKWRGENASENTMSARRTSSLKAVPDKKETEIPWSASEDDALREEAGKYTLLEICKRHSRGSMDVFARMQILGLQGMKKD